MGVFQMSVAHSSGVRFSLKMVFFFLAFLILIPINHTIAFAFLNGNQSAFVYFTNTYGLGDAEGFYGQLIIALSVIESASLLALTLYLIKIFRNRH